MKAICDVKKAVNRAPILNKGTVCLESIIVVPEYI